MSTINFIPETIKSKRQKQIWSKRGFFLSFSFLALTLLAIFITKTYQAILDGETNDLTSKINAERQIIQSLKETEGVYQSLKMKTAILAQTNLVNRNQAEVLEKIDNLASQNETATQELSLDETGLGVIGTSSSFEKLASFLQGFISGAVNFKVGKINFKNINYDEQKGQVEFSLEATIKTW